jgi:energy-coupling factor transporter ATP-binding protein EcfA2
MKIKVSSIALIGTEREYTFSPGLNIITGPIATGKTTLLRCIRGILGSGLQNFPREARETITNLASKIEIADNAYNIVRPFVTTQTAKVDIAGTGETRRLPALQVTSTLETTYGRWLLEKLGLPILDVPIAPTRPDSDSSPVSINDFMLYCYLRQDEIDNSVYGHDNHFKNTKRKYVFEIVYGKYNVQLAQLYDELREVSRELSRLRGKSRTIDEFLADTPFENKAHIEWELNNLADQLRQIETKTTESSDEIIEASKTKELRGTINEIDERIGALDKRLEFEKESAEQLTQLLAQLETQSNRITRSIVAGNYLLDFDFIICPRCGSNLEIDRGSEEICYLCLQHPEPRITRNDLINEQDRLEKQILETRELVQIHQDTSGIINSEIQELHGERQELADELNFLTDSYVSDSASEIASSAQERAEIQERIIRLNDYLQLFERREESLGQISRFETKKQELEGSIDAILSSETGIEDRIQYLETKFREILAEFDAPRFIESGYTGIDRNTYLPLFEGRRFDELQSQGLKVIVNVAHTLAHQLTSIEYGLNLPNILLIDGITANIGSEGLDWQRVENIFGYLISLSESQGETLQIIIAENSVPEAANNFIRVRLSEDDKLIPSELLVRDDL